VFLEEENLVHAEHFGMGHFVFKLVFLSDIFEKFNALDTSMDGQDTNIVLVTDSVQAFIGRLRLWVRKLEGKVWTCFLI
jgi:hypothetical protein